MRAPDSAQAKALRQVRATNKKGEKKLFTYPNPSGGGT